MATQRPDPSAPVSVTPPWSDALGWGDEPYYSTILTGDVDGDGKAEVLARSSTGMETWSFDVATGVWYPLCLDAPPLTDAAFWTNESFHHTLRLGDVNGDGRDELIGRNGNGVDTWAFDDQTRQWRLLSEASPRLGETWESEACYSTLRLADLDGDGQAELFARCHDGVLVWKFDREGARWTQVGSASFWSDAYSWDESRFYETIRVGDVDGDGKWEVVGRGPNGIEVYKFAPEEGGKSSPGGYPGWIRMGMGMQPWPDTQYWWEPQYYETILLADVNGDGRAELLGRGPSGMETYRYDPDYDRWEPLSLGTPAWADGNGWAFPQYYSTIRAADVDGDGQAELLARGYFGVETHRFDVVARKWTPFVQGPEWSDPNGFAEHRHYSTLRLADVNADGKAELMIRSASGLETRVYDPGTLQWIAPVPRVKVDARLMENYVLATPVTGGTQIETAPNADGELEVFSVGTDGVVYNLYPDPGSDTGWSQASLGISAPSPFAVSRTDEGQMIVIVPRQSGGVQYVVEDPTASVRWSAPRTLELNGALIQHVTARNLDDRLYVAALSLSGTDRSEGPSYGAYFGRWSGDAPDLGPFRIGASKTTEVGISRSGGRIGLFAVSDSVGVVWLDSTEQKGGGSSQTILTSGMKTYGAAFSEDTSGEVQIFSFTLTGLYYLQTVNGVRSWRTLGSGSFKQLRADCNAEGLLEIFALASDGYLHHAHQMAGSTSWTGLGRLGLVFSQIASARNGDGYSELFGVGSSDGLVVDLWQDADTGAWTHEKVAVEGEDGAGEIRPVLSYTTEITVLDDVGQPAPGEEVEIRTSELALLTLNGITQWVDPQRPAILRANPGGMVTVMAQTEKLATPMLQVRTGFMPAGTTLVVEPNGSVQQRLRSVTGADLLAAKGQRSGAPLLQGSYATQEVADNLAAGVAQCMTLVAPTTGTPSAPPQQATPGGVSYTTAPSSSISHQVDTAAVPEQHWMMDFGTGVPTFTRLTAQEAEQHITQRKTTFPSWSDVTEAVEDLGEELADTLEAAAEGTAQVANVIVTTVESAVNAAITFVVDGVQYFYEATVKTVEDAFEIVEAVFEQVQAFFEDLFDWLAFLFDWDDILRTKEAVKHGIDEAFGAMQDGLQYIKSQADTLFATLESEADAAFQAMIASTLGTQTLARVEGSAPVPRYYDQSTANNVVQTAFYNSSGGPVLTPASLQSVQTTIDTLISVIYQEAASFEASPAFSRAVAYFEQAVQAVGSDFGRLVELTVAGVMSALSGLTQLALEIARTLVDALLDALSAVVGAIRDLLYQEWKIPFVKDLYAYIAGAPLTPIDLFSLIVAVPSTVYYKLEYGEAPFASDADVEAFESAFNAGAIAEKAGIPHTASTLQAAATAQSADQDSKTTAVMLGVFAMLSEGAYTLARTIQDGLPLSDPSTTGTPQEFGISLAALVSEWAFWIFTCPWYTTPIDLTKAGANQMAGVYWLMQPLPLLTDAGLVVASRKITSLNGDLGAGATTFFGCMNLALVSALADLRRKEGTDATVESAANILNSLGGVFEILRLKPVVDATMGLSQPALMTLDLVSYGGCTILTGKLMAGQAAAS